MTVSRYGVRGWPRPAGGGYVSSYTGAVAMTYGAYVAYKFTATGSITLAKAAAVDLLVVAGGGGGNHSTAPPQFAGGGAGGLILTSFTAPAGTYPIVVGLGGAPANSGQDSTAFGYTAIGGGRGGAGGGGNGATGGSGGGQGGSGAGGTANNAAGTSGQGYAGGSATFGGGLDAAGGGGGAGGVGANAVGATSGIGGPGLLLDITGVPFMYAAGGGRTASEGAGYAGSPNALPNTGSGGAGTAGSGGSGVVVVRVRR